MSNPYLLLGVAQNAPIQNIKSAWKAHAFALHPDRNPSLDAAPRFRAIQGAWESLRDNRAEVDSRLAREAVQARWEAGERIRLAAQRQAFLDRMAQTVMDAELQREMASCPRRDLYDVRFYGEPLTPPGKGWRRENARTTVWDLINLLVGR